MTSAEAIRELRLLVIAAVASGTPLRDRDVQFMLETVGEIARDGVDPVIELRIRRFRRLYGDARAGLFPSAASRLTPVCRGTI